MGRPRKAEMTTTTRIMTTTLLNVEDALGEYASDFDVDGLRSAYRDAIQECLPEGITLALNGDVYAKVGLEIDGEPLDAETLDLQYAADSIDFWGLAEQYDRTAQP